MEEKWFWGQRPCVARTQFLVFNLIGAWRISVCFTYLMEHTHEYKHAKGLRRTSFSMNSCRRQQFCYYSIETWRNDVNSSRVSICSPKPCIGSVSEHASRAAHNFRIKFFDSILWFVCNVSLSQLTVKIIWKILLLPTACICVCGFKCCCAASTTFDVIARARTHIPAQTRSDVDLNRKKKENIENEVTCKFFYYMRHATHAS